MSTRYDKNFVDRYSLSSGYEGQNIPEEFEVPPNSLEDIDRSVFDLFESQLPFQYDLSGVQTGVPVIFAAGERFAVLRRKQPLRDKSGALILPLISIVRSGFSQTNPYGAGCSENEPHVIRKQISKDDPIYQRLFNKYNIENSDELVNYNTDSDSKLKTRRSKPRIVNDEILKSKLVNNLIEVFTLPPVKYVTATYEITFWTQYTQQMNDMIVAMMSLYQNNHQRTFQLETRAGYWFVGYVGEQLNKNDNFDNFLDDERLVKYSFELTVPSYIVSPKFPGSLSTVRRFVSSPQIAFDMEVGNFELDKTGGIPSHDVNDYVLEDIRTEEENLTGQNIASKIDASHDPRGIFKQKSGAKLNLVRKNVNNTRQGEKVYKNVIFNEFKQ